MLDLFKEAEERITKTTCSAFQHMLGEYDGLISKKDLFDYKVVESLIDCLSRDNLPWLLPSASGHHWLGQRLNRLIDEGENND